MRFEIIKPGTRIDFIGKWRVAAALSVALLLAGALAIPLRGIQLGIDFAGGTEVQVRFDEGVEASTGPIRDVAQSVGIEGASVIRYGAEGTNEYLIKFRGGREGAAPVEAQDEGAAAEGSEAGAGAESAEAGSGEGSEGSGAGERPSDALLEQGEDRVRALEEGLAERIGPLRVERVEYVGPKVGAQLREDGLQAIAIACALILVYVGFRFSARFAPGAVVALLHDILMTSAIWVILGLEFDLRVLAALLAILGYSLNDTIILYDRIRENLELRTRQEFAEVLNRSVNQTLSRTLLTSLTTLAAVLSLLFLGGAVIEPFALAMAIGIVVGTYSSIYVAAPTLLWLETRFGGESAGAGSSERRGGGARGQRGTGGKAAARA